MRPRWEMVLPVTTATPEASNAVAVSTLPSVPGQIIEPPSGLGNAPISTSDAAFPLVDGVTHYLDLYGPRIITLPKVGVRSLIDCTADLTSHQQGTPEHPAQAEDVLENVQKIQQAWRRRQADIEAWVTVNGQGPFAVLGRPRVATVDWMDGYLDYASMLLRFDCADHLLYLLDVDDDGNVVGDGWRSVQVELATYAEGRTYDRTYPLTYGDAASVDVVALVGGTVAVPPVIEFHGTLTNPRLENVTTGQLVGYNGVLSSFQTVTFDLRNRSVEEGGASRYQYSMGDIGTLRLVPGGNRLKLTTKSPSDDGYATVRWRAARL